MTDDGYQGEEVIFCQNIEIINFLASSENFSTIFYTPAIITRISKQNVLESSKSADHLWSLSILCNTDR